MTALNELRKSADAARENIDNSKPVFVEDGSMAVGHAKRQGDVAVEMIGKLPKRAVKVKRPDNGQVAPGNTKGSRHCVSDVKVDFYEVDDGDQLSNICIVAYERWELKHPEHADYSFPKGTYRVHHQQNEQFERILD